LLLVSPGRWRDQYYEELEDTEASAKEKGEG
jgi:hypothetical protein